MPDSNTPKLTHLNEMGDAQMVDVGAKIATVRRAVAEGEIRYTPEVLDLLRHGKTAKGDVFTVAKVAAIQAAKRTSDLIPLCHPLALTKVDVAFRIDDERTAVVVQCEVGTTGPTGVEMEALTAVSVALLTLYDMTKSTGKTMVIGNIRLLAKSGGKSGDFQAEGG